jgi:hypothetical protein
MIERAEVERAIVDDEAMVEQLALLIESGSALAAWPAPLRSALALALADLSMSRPEGWKAVALRRHLFGAAGVIPDELAAPRTPSPAERKRAERVRSALTSRIQFRGATHLLRAAR